MHLAGLFTVALTTLAVNPSNVVANALSEAPKSIQPRGSTDLASEQTYLTWVDGQFRRVKKDCELWLFDTRTKQVKEKRYENYNTLVVFSIEHGFNVQVERKDGYFAPQCIGHLTEGELPPGYDIAIFQAGKSPEHHDTHWLRYLPHAESCVVAIQHGYIKAQKIVPFGEEAWFHKFNIGVSVEPQIYGPYNRRRCKGKLSEDTDLPYEFEVLVRDNLEGAKWHQIISRP
ncbi:uncharacterized protein PgNI_09301 [Pyricularia grisea]|uniref:Uncharacterized protein n=1 Tax=Pyricularia grisea TaxID=148305 RepID=A0A6P8ASS7_PYRGI|nr:uncharacterized protein PgNI_09301 [Pyricularia grisea]TLD05163.1 hypothetical protein PgNI_09301 [Pyricularia grisea]